MISHFTDLCNYYTLWPLERLDIMYQVKRLHPEGKVANKYWIEDREWDNSFNFRNTGVFFER